VVTICDHLVSFRASQTKDEVSWKSPSVPSDLLIELLCGNPVKRGKIGINQRLVPANDEDAPCNVLGGGRRRETTRFD
jgi:hypothetical protein